MLTHAAGPHRPKRPRANSISGRQRFSPAIVFFATHTPHDTSARVGPGLRRLRDHGYPISIAALRCKLDGKPVGTDGEEGAQASQEPFGRYRGGSRHSRDTTTRSCRQRRPEDANRWRSFGGRLARSQRGGIAREISDAKGWLAAAWSCERGQLATPASRAGRAAEATVDDVGVACARLGADHCARAAQRRREEARPRRRLPHAHTGGRPADPAGECGAD